MKNLQYKFTKLLFCILWLAFGVSAINAQSTNSEYPTPVTSNEISGTIKARDVGDARLTSYYYVFNGTQGDVFVNITANNLNGDIDVFAADGLRPLSKIRLFADTSPTETGRIVYLRQPLKLILRVEGRTPDDNPATFTIKFAGSFAAMEGGNDRDQPNTPTVESEQKGSVRVNSVGTIIEEKKEPKETVESKKDENVETAKAEEPAADKPTKTTAKTTRPKVIVTDNTKAEPDKENAESDKKETEIAKTKEPITRTRKALRNKKTRTTPPETKTETKVAQPDPLENVRLVVLMKDGEKIEYPMPEVFRFSLNNNVLTVILKNGKIERRSIFDIQKFSVE